MNISNINWICHHLHIDKSRVMNKQLLLKSLSHMKEKWYLMKEIKEGYTDDDLLFRMNCSIDKLYKQNCKSMKTFIDVDQTIGLRAIETALKVKRYWEKVGVTIQIGTQPLEGLETSDNIKLFEEACKLCDFVGCLPSRDKSKEKHLDIAFTIAKDLDKDLEAHIDQCNTPNEKETELFCDYVEKYKYNGKARTIHSISLACHPLEYQNDIAKRMNYNNIGVIICPSAAISMTQHNEYYAPIHNSIGPVKVFLDNKVEVGLGVDNIEDIFMPFCDGSLEFELRLLAESCRLYDINSLTKIAENKLELKF